jgi:4'-phosphopantetheinyl transferase
VRDGASAELWLAWVGDHIADVDDFGRRFLSDEECERLRSYRSREAAERYVVTRSLVRSVLGARLRATPRDVPVTRTTTGKPLAEGVHFNVSHSGDLILVAVSHDRAVGVDVERRREVQRVEALVARWLTDEERETLGALRAAGENESDAFLRVWSLKEARLKALGVGISGATGAAVQDVDVEPLDAWLDELAPRPGERGYVGAVAFA